MSLTEATMPKGIAVLNVFLAHGARNLGEDNIGVFADHVAA